MRFAPGSSSREVELDLEHRATGRDLAGFVHRGRQLRDILLAFGPQATNHRGLRLPLVGWVVGVAHPRVAPVALLGLADDLWSGEERGFRAHLRAGRTTGRAQARRDPALRAAADALALGRAARRAGRERAQPARHAARAGAEGVRARLARAAPDASRSARRRRPARSLRSSRDGDAGGLGIERARRRARFRFRGAVLTEAALERDRGARGPHPPRRAPLARHADRARRRCFASSTRWAGKPYERGRPARPSTSSSRAASSPRSARASSPPRSAGS